MANIAIQSHCPPGELFQYHALGVKPFRIPLTKKYVIEKVNHCMEASLPPATIK